MNIAAITTNTRISSRSNGSRLRAYDEPTSALTHSTQRSFTVLNRPASLQLLHAETGPRKNLWELECGPMPSVMAALPNIGGALYSTPQTLADAHCWRHKDAKPVEISWSVHTTGPISAASAPMFTVLWGLLEEALLLNKFFPDCRYVP